MTNGSVEPTPARAPILVLGLGNLLLADDAVGLSLVNALSAGSHPQIEFIDGGTQGLALLGQLENRQALLICDAASLGAEPGTVHLLQGEEIWSLRANRPGSAHEGNALGLLQAARLLGIEPPSVTVIGIEPALLSTQIGLSPQVAAALPQALQLARDVLNCHTANPT